MTLKITQFSVDLLNNSASLAFSESDVVGQFRFVNVQVPIPSGAKSQAGQAEIAARSAAIRILQEALSQLENPPASVFD